MKRHIKRIITKLAVMVVERASSNLAESVEDDVTVAPPEEAADATKQENPNDILVDAYRTALLALANREHLRSDYAADLQYAFDNYDDQAVHQIVTEHDGVLKPMQDFNEALYQGYCVHMNRLDFMSFIIVANKCSESLEAITAQEIENLVLDYVEETTHQEGEFALDFELQLLSAGGKFLYPPVSILGEPSEASIFGSKMKNIAAALRETGFAPEGGSYYTNRSPYSEKDLELAHQILKEDSLEDSLHEDPQQEETTLTTIPSYTIGEA